MSGTDYVYVHGRINQTTKGAVLLDKTWIPRSCIHGADEGEIETWKGHEVDIRIFEWLANREGLV